ncbi:MAG: translation initiation factor IF-5A [Promethearchaeia archaeon]
MSYFRKEIQKLKSGNYLMVDDEPCIIKSTERSKSGKHGHAKVRVICEGMFDENKRSETYPSGSTVMVPEIIKSSAQINYIEDNVINIMDLESYESLDIKWPREEKLKKKVEELRENPDEMASARIEYWKVAGRTLIHRIIID